MLIVAQGDEIGRYPGLEDQMFQLRARAFSERRGWRVEVQDGRERDRFDDLGPLYLCLLEADRLLASLRLLPTLGPHMASDVFPEVLGPAKSVRHPLIWESSRFCVDTEAVRVFGRGGINIATRLILSGLFGTAQDAGLEKIISVYDIGVERILRRAGCRFSRLGPVVSYDGLDTVCGLFEVSDAVIRRLSTAGDPTTCDRQRSARSTRMSGAATGRSA
ncbi:acyl-homoserine-lactone synthase [Cereibacter sphaeroides]|uniref:acyl-homoserine-lactone synthase n=1 Tax=Cereibacter sphaeroides TaxID=1063 RepID=UPI001F245715|nr:acyl-homoserine-lactone synthase [Cereibacter sphaeroides]MCE6958341.1 acyl-homoserine-lactone synthase [Cereibacter sphaeroides]MCE6972208.1 acyl-homoserine-lactone synthase [Cereibacter sphaeroides]